MIYLSHFVNNFFKKNKFSIYKTIFVLFLLVSFYFFYLVNTFFVVTDINKLPGDQLGIIWIIPFVGILLSIAILPLIVPVFWHRNYGKVSAFWSILFILPPLSRNHLATSGSVSETSPNLAFFNTTCHPSYKNRIGKFLF